MSSVPLERIRSWSIPRPALSAHGLLRLPQKDRLVKGSIGAVSMAVESLPSSLVFKDGH